MASDYVGFRMTGIDELTGMFEELGKVGRRQAIAGALKKAAKPVAVEAALLAPKGDASERGARKPLAQTIKIRTTLPKSQRKKRGGRRAEVEVFVVSTDPKAHLIEFGHLLKKGRKTEQRVIGYVPAIPFMRPAFERHADEVVKRFGELIFVEVVRIARRWRRQAERGRVSRAAARGFQVEI